MDKYVNRELINQKLKNADSFFKKLGYMNIVGVIIIPIVIILLLLIIKPWFIMDYAKKITTTSDSDVQVCYDEKCKDVLEYPEDADKKKKMIENLSKYGTGRVNILKFLTAFIVFWIIFGIIHIFVSYAGIMNIGKTSVIDGGFGFYRAC